MAEIRVGLEAARGAHRHAARAHHALGLREDALAALPGATDLGQGVPLSRVRGDRRLDLEVGGRHPCGEGPVLGAADERPAALHSAPGVPDIAAPQREGRRRAGGRDLELRVGRVVDLERTPAQQARGTLVDARLDLEHRGGH